MVNEGILWCLICGSAFFGNVRNQAHNRGCKKPYSTKNITKERSTLAIWRLDDLLHMVFRSNVGDLSFLLLLLLLSKQSLDKNKLFVCSFPPGRRGSKQILIACGATSGMLQVAMRSKCFTRLGLLLGPVVRHGTVTRCSGYRWFVSFLGAWPSFTDMNSTELLLLI